MKVTITIILTALVVAGLVYGAMRGAGLANATASGQAQTVVRVEPAARGDVTEVISAPGEIEPKKKVAISARVSARIKELPCEEGANVTMGDEKSPPTVLVRFDATDLEAALNSAEARYRAQQAAIDVERATIDAQQSSLAAMQVQLDQAKRELDRQKTLLATGDAAQSRVDELQATYDDLAARLESSKHNLDAARKNLVVMQHNLEAADADILQARDNLSYTTITAPMDGVVTKINAEVGEVAVMGTMNNAGTVIMEVADLSRMLLVAQVDEADIGGVKVGQHAKIRIQAYPGRVFTGTVDNIALVAETQPNKHFKVEILLDTNGERIYSGLSADVDIEVNTYRDQVKVPSQAVLGRATDELPLEVRKDNPAVDMSKTIVPVVYRMIDGKAVVTPVRIGASDQTHTVIEAGLNEGDRVVVGPFKVLEGLKHEQMLKDEAEVDAAMPTPDDAVMPDAADGK